ncbi:unnamed protein product, partial [Chrysoparadoxa australica]
MIDAPTWWSMGDKSYSPEMITQLAKGMAQYSPTWLEEPLPPEMHEAYALLNQMNYVPIASGEHEQTFEGFQDIIEKRAVDYVQMDVCCQGGFDMGVKVFKHTQAAGLRFAFHCWGSALEVLASAQLGICWPESLVEWLEYPCHEAPGKAGMYPFPLAEEILKEPLEIKNGYLHVPNSPGLGIEINEKIIEKKPYIKAPWSY